MIVGIDHGYAAIKTRNFCFPSGIEEFEFEPYTSKNMLQYDGGYYICGSARQPLIRDKTINNTYYLLTLAAIAKEIQYRNASQDDPVVLAAGLPLAGFGREKEKFRDYLLRDCAPVCFMFEKQKYQLTIEDIFLYPQGYSAIISNIDLIENEPSVIIADIGGWTVDVMRLDDLIPNAATCRSLEFGMIRCKDEVAEQVRRSTGLSVTQAQIDRILRDEDCSMNERAREIVIEHGQKYVKRLLSAMMESGFDVNAVPILLMGGGAIVVKRRLTEQDGLCRVLMLDDIHANAIGYENIVEHLLQAKAYGK